jgi:hypothetical protein
MNFKNSYEDIIEKTFKHIPATRRDRQKAIYDSCMGNDGLVPPIQVNISYFSTLTKTYFYFPACVSIINYDS